jgi:hypothetical protein
MHSNLTDDHPLQRESEPPSNEKRDKQNGLNQSYKHLPNPVTKRKKNGYSNPVK